MKRYKAVFNELTSEGVFGISLVENPAMEGMFVALNKHTEIQLKEVDKEKRILMGLVLEPNKDVYRNQGGEEFYLSFDEETIKNLSYHFFKSGNQKNSTIEHKDQIEGVTFVESWLVEDSKVDKSNLYGFNYPVGSWVATMKVDSDDVWNEYVKTGKVQGFSVDAMLELKEINLKSEINMSSKILAELRKIGTKIGLTDETTTEEVTETKEEVVSLGEVKSVDGEVTFMFEGDEMVVGGSIFAMGGDNEKIPVPAGEYAVEGNQVIVIEEDGVIAAINGAEVEEKTEAPMSETTTETPTNPLMDMEKVKSMTIKYQEETNKSITELTEMIKGLKNDILELSEQPAQKPVKQIAQVELNQKGRILRKIRG